MYIREYEGALLKARHSVVSTWLIDTAGQCECLDPRVQTASLFLSTMHGLI